MPLQSQFSLSLELTKLLPLGSAIDAGRQAVVNLARELQKSGSDLVVEQDLAQIFGRNSITARFESSFRTAVKESKTKQLSSYLDIVLESGAGPTVRRSLQNRFFFSMVVQLSLLSWAHELDSLARALAAAFERRLDDAPPDEKHFPGYDGILGTLRACRDQTCEFSWDLIFRAVEETLPQVPQLYGCSSRQLPFALLLGLLDVLFAVQALPDDRYIHVVAKEGYATVVVWAHHVLGLNVTLYIGQQAVRFGQGREHVVFELPTGQSPTDSGTTICLLNATADDDADLFRLSADEAMDVPLNDDIRISAYGYGRVCLEAEIGKNPSLVRDLAHQAVAYSWIGNHKSWGRPDTWKVDVWKERDCSETLLWSRNRMLEAGRFVFGGIELDMETFESWLEDPNQHAWVGGDGVSVSALQLWLEQHYGQSLQPLIPLGHLSSLMSCLSGLVNVFITVPDLESCRDLPLRQYTRSLRNSRFETFVLMQGMVPLQGFDTFRMLALLLLGLKDKRSKKLDRAALVSSHGWSIYLPSINMRDPEDVRPNVVRVARGVPTRLGERKFWIVDATESTMKPKEAQTFAISDGKHTVLSRIGVKERKVFVGSRGRVFEAALALLHSEGRSMMGFRSLQELRWSTRLLPGCPHTVCDPNELAELAIPVETHSLDLETRVRMRDSDKGRVYIALTGGNNVARWLMMDVMRTLSHTIEQNYTPGPALFLRVDDCCLGCAIEHVQDPLRPTFLVL